MRILKTKGHKDLRILVGTPVHECKDYAMERWLRSVSKLNYPYDLLLVDNSDNLEYIDKLRKYCKKYGVSNYKLVHIDVGRNAILDERLASSREVIRKEVLDKGYDGWFSLECDIITPPDALSKLVNLIDDYWVVSHVYPSRADSHQINEQLGVTLVKRPVLEKYTFINGYGFVNPLLPDCWYGNDVWFIRRIDISSRGKHINVGGIIKPIYHLSE